MRLTRMRARLRIWGLPASPPLPLFKMQPRRMLSTHRFPFAKKHSFLMALAIITLFVAPTAAQPLIRAYHKIRDDAAGLEILQLAFSLKMAETVLAVLSVTLVTLVYSFLIRRGTLMSTTALYPRRSIEANIGKILSLGWPDSSDDIVVTATPPTDASEKGKATVRTDPLGLTDSSADSIQLLYLGKMVSDGHPDRIAKGVLQCAAKPVGELRRSPLWLTSGSPLIKAIVQLLVWEWMSFWLILLMLTSTLMFNGFFSDQLSIDSYPRLTVLLIYAASYMVHSIYVWNVCSNFFTNVASGAAWSLLERAKFGVADTSRLQNRETGQRVEFKSIDKASKEFVPTTFQAWLKHETVLGGFDEDPIPSLNHEDQKEDSKDVSLALATLGKAQDTERTTATHAINKALERVISNAMIMMGVTLSTGFSAWISQQSTSNTPNNFDTQQIGSLALLASLSLGAATMFTSALHLSIMDSSYRTILSLKETKINGQAVAHYKKRRSKKRQLSFTRGTISVSKVGFTDIFATNKWRNIFGVMILGPAFALLPETKDHERTSADIEFDFLVAVREKTVLLTTRETEHHAKGKDGINVEAVNVCYIEDQAGNEEKAQETV